MKIVRNSMYMVMPSFSSGAPQSSFMYARYCLCYYKGAFLVAKVHERKKGWFIYN